MQELKLQLKTIETELDKMYAMIDDLEDISEGELFILKERITSLIIPYSYIDSLEYLIKD